MTQPTTMKVVIDDLRATSGAMNNIASGFYNDGSGPILKSVTSADTELDSTKACGEVGDILLAYAQTLGDGVSEHAGKLSAAAGHYERGDTAAAESIDFDPPEERELEVGDDPSEPGYDPVNEYEQALQNAGLLDGPSSGMYREWLQNAADNDVPPETIVEIARQQNISPASFDVLKGLERVTNDNQNDDPKDDTDYFMLPENVTAEQARQAALMTYIFNAGTGYGSSRGNANNDFAETPYSAAEVQRIKDRQEANSWSYDLLEHATGSFAATPNGMVMGVGGELIQQTVSQQAGTCVGDVFAVNMDHPPGAAAEELRKIIQTGTPAWQSDDGKVHRNVDLDLDRVLHHEERHSQQWAQKGFLKFVQEYFTPTGAEHNPFETNAGAGDGGYH